MIRFYRFRVLLLLLLAGISPISTNLFAQNAKQQVNELIRDTQKQGTRAGRFTLVWWLPPEFWRATLRANGTITADQIEGMVGSISDVNVFIIVDGKFNPSTIDYTPEADVAKNLAVVDTNGKPLALIPENKQPAAAKTLLAMMRPVLGSMLGEFGKHSSFFVFEGKAKDGSRLIDPNKPGILMVKFNAEEFRWRLPLGSLLPQKMCPKCNEVFPGNYAFCPFDATPLVAKKTSEQ